MKRLLIIFTAISSLLATTTSCNNDNSAFELSSSERITQLLTQTETILNDASNGWVMEFFYGSDLTYGGLLLFMDFNNGNVDICSEEGGANLIVSSTYSYDQDQSATLNFDTYNSLLHCYSEPSSGNTTGQLGDFEFIIIESTSQKITLRGKRNDVMYYMYPLAENLSWFDQMTSYLKLTTEMERLSEYTLTVDTEKYSLSREVYGSTKRRKFNYTDEDGNTLGLPFTYTFDGLKFYEPVTFNGITFQEMYWDGYSAFYDLEYGISIK